jgi:hypothetical protein
MVGVYFKLQMKPTSTVLPRARSAMDLLKFECNNGCVAKKISAPGCVDILACTETKNLAENGYCTMKSEGGTGGS